MRTINPYLIPEIPYWESRILDLSDGKGCFIKLSEEDETIMFIDITISAN